ncbi:hypothetical protein HDU76_010057, partial [Blyttiomyces sp. JEL0837]
MYVFYIRLTWLAKFATLLSDTNDSSDPICLLRICYQRSNLAFDDKLDDQQQRHGDIDMKSVATDLPMSRTTTASTAAAYAHGLIATGIASHESQQGMSLDVQQQVHEQQHIVTDVERRHVIDKIFASAFSAIPPNQRVNVKSETIMGMIVQFESWVFNASRDKGMYIQYQMNLIIANAKIFANDANERTNLATSTHLVLHTRYNLFRLKPK